MNNQNQFNPASMIPYCEGHIYHNGDLLPYKDSNDFSASETAFDNGSSHNIKIIAGILPLYVEEEMHNIESVMDVLYFDNEAKEFFEYADIKCAERETDEYGRDSLFEYSMVDKHVLSEDAAFYKLCDVSRKIAVGTNRIPVFTEQAVQALQEGNVKNLYLAFEEPDNSDKITVSFVADENVLKNMGLYDAVFECETPKEQSDMILDKLNSIVEEYGKLQDMELINDGHVDFEKINEQASPVSEESSDNILQYIKAFTDNLANIIINRAESETDRYETKKNSFGINEYIYIGNVFKSGSDFINNTEFNFGQSVAFLPLKPLSGYEIDLADPKGKIIKEDSDYHLILDYSASAAIPEAKVQITDSSEKPRTYALGYDATCSILNSFKYEISAHDSHHDTYFVCAVSNNRKEASNMAELAFDSEMARVSNDKSLQGIPAIDEVIIVDTAKNCKIVSVDKKGFHQINPQSKEALIDRRN